MTRKLIAIDLDKTLLTSAGRVSAPSQAYLRQLQRDGHIIVINSGRIRASILLATDGAQFADYLITDSGGRIYRMSDGAKLVNHYLEQATLGQLLSCPETWLAHLDVCDEDFYWKCYFDPAYHQSGGPCQRIVQYKSELLECSGEIGHVNLIPRTRADQTELSAWLKDQKIPGTQVMIMQDSGNDQQWLELFPVGIDKYRTLRILADQLEIPNRDIIAFGDALNDIELLANCGTGVAMANALPEVKAVATAVTDLDNDHDGVIDYLAKHL